MSPVETLSKTSLRLHIYAGYLHISHVRRKHVLVVYPCREDNGQPLHLLYERRHQSFLSGKPQIQRSEGSDQSMQTAHLKTGFHVTWLIYCAQFDLKISVVAKCFCYVC